MRRQFGTIPVDSGLPCLVSNCPPCSIRGSELTGWMQMQMHMEIQMRTQNADDDRGHQLERARLVFLSTVSDAKIALMQFAFSGLHSSPPSRHPFLFGEKRRKVPVECQIVCIFRQKTCILGNCLK